MPDLTAPMPDVLPDRAADGARDPAGAGERVRPLRRDDMPAVGRLFEAVFWRRDQAPSQALLDHLSAVYLDHPWQDGSTPSLVFESANGAIDGFVGVLPLRLVWNGRMLKGAVAGSLMVRDAAHRPMAGARLLRVFLNGPQDISFGDTTNATAEGLWRRLGGGTLPMSSMEFMKIVRPARFAATVAANRVRWARFVLKPVGSLIDGVARLFRRKPSEPGWQDESVDDGAFIAAMAALRKTSELTLADDPAALRWLLEQAALKRRHGPLHRRVVRDKAGRIIGAYLIYAQRGEPAELLQVMNAPRHGDAVLASMDRFADDTGCSAVRGRTQTALLPALFRAGCLMRHRSFTVIDTKDSALMQSVEHRSTLGGFFGETWLQIVSDRFDGLRAGSAG